MIYEQRTYEIPNNTRKAFHERFENHAIRIMANYGFRVIGCWDEIIGDMQNFTYILAWDDMNTRMEAWSKFNNDQEWTLIKKESAEKYGELVRKTSNKILQPTKYSQLT